MRRTLLLGLSLLLAACGASDSTGPSSSTGSPADIAILTEQLRPSSISSRFCVVHTVLLNRTGHTISVTLRWRAFDAGGSQIGTALDVIDEIAPHTQAISDSTSFGISPAIACGQIARFERAETTVYNFERPRAA